MPGIAYFPPFYSRFWTVSALHVVIFCTHDWGQPFVMGHKLHSVTKTEGPIPERDWMIGFVLRVEMGI